MNGTSLCLVPAGHVLGSAQLVIEYQGTRVVVSGDYKRRPDPTCPPFEPQPCDLFVTEATFALPVFRHPPDKHEIDKLWHSRRLPDPVIALASGWMRVKQRAKARGIELPLVISDHADWDELTQTLDDVGAPEIWVTHGREEALVHYAAQRGREARALALTGFDEEEE